MSNKKIAIIGANSFLASNLRDELVKHDFELSLFGRREITSGSNIIFFYFNYPETPIDLDSLLTYDTIIYTAGAGIQSNISTAGETILQVNAFIPINIIQFLHDREYKGHFVTFGSYFEIGNSSIDKFYTEDEYVANSNIVPNDYCISKRLLTQYVYQRINNSKMTLTHLVLPNIYGIGENKNRIIPYLVENIKLKKPLHLSSGTQKRQFLHVRDVAEIIIKIIEQPVNGIFNLGEPVVHSIKEVVQMVLNQMPDKERLKINFGTIQKNDAGMQFLALDTSKMQKELKWKPIISLTEGIREYL